MATKWGILGAGLISADFCKAVHEVLNKDDHKFVAVAARDLGRAQQFAKRFNIPNAYGSYEELGNDPNIDVVYIGTIHTTHCDVSKQMLHAGKNVLCEKPMSLNSRQLEEVLTLAEEKKLFFMEAVWARFFPLIERVRNELPLLGDVKLLTACLVLPLGSVERLAKKELGGGVTMDVGIYPIQLAAMVFDEMPEKIMAAGNLTAEGVDENGCVILKYKNGSMASLAYHMNSGKADNRASIIGTKGNIEIDAPFWCPLRMTTPTGTYTTELPMDGYNFINAAGLAFQASYVREALLKGEKECSQMSHRHSRILMSILDEVRRQIGVRYDVDD